LASHDSPLNRLVTDGTHSLTTTDLIAVILADDDAQNTARSLVNRYTDLHALAQANPIDLGRTLSLSDAGRIAAAFELCRRLARENILERPLIKTSADAATLMNDMSVLTQEHVRVILLDINRRVIAVPTLYIGTLTASVLRASEVYREAILRGSPMLILVHNHPSGDPTPSPEDVEMSRALAAAGRLLDIALLDHLIIGRGAWVSLRDLGFTF